jgi:sec-independent protein translocase protein TatC
MSLADHLYELRNRLAKSFLAIGLGMAFVGLVIYQPVFDLLREPYCRTPAAGPSCDLYVRDIFAQFAVRLRVAGIGGTLLAAPVWLYQLGAFITPALHRKERRYAAGFLAGSMVLFGIGVAFAYLTMDRGLQFLLTIGGDGLVTLPDLASYLSFVTLTLFAFGAAFLFPVVLVFLNLAGVLSARRMGGMWRSMLVGIAFMSAVLTPSTDPITFLAMALPVAFLYVCCVGVAWLVDRARGRRNKGKAGEELADDVASEVDPHPSPLDA